MIDFSPFSFVASIPRPAICIVCNACLCLVWNLSGHGTSIPRIQRSGYLSTDPQLHTYTAMHTFIFESSCVYNVQQLMPSVEAARTLQRILCCCELNLMILYSFGLSDSNDFGRSCHRCYRSCSWCGRHCPDRAWTVHHCDCHHRCSQDLPAHEHLRQIYRRHDFPYLPDLRYSHCRLRLVFPFPLFSHPLFLPALRRSSPKLSSSSLVGILLSCMWQHR